MAINNTIDYGAPDGSVITVSQLDDAIRTAVTDIRERMETLIDTAAATWADTTAKEFIEGLARLYTATTAPSAPTGHTLKDGQVWIDTDAVVGGTGAQYREAGAWVDFPVTTQMLKNDVVTTAKIVNDAVTLPKIPINAIWQLHANLTNVLDDTVTGTTLTLIGTGAGDDFTITFAPDSATSVIVCVLQCRPSLESGSNAFDAGELAIVETVGPTTLAQCKTFRQDHINDGQGSERAWVTLIGVQTGVTGSRTYVARMAGGSASQVIHLNGDESTARFMVFELKTQ